MHSTNLIVIFLLHSPTPKLHDYLGLSAFGTTAMPDTSSHLVFWQDRAQTGRVDFPQSFFYLWYYHSCLQIEDNLLVEDKQLLLLVHESADKNGNTKNKGKRLGKVLFVAQVHSLLSTCSSILSCIPRRRLCYPGGVGGQSRWAVPDEHTQIIEWNL